jgi:tetraacyldisaccharide 4'-kinase
LLTAVPVPPGVAVFYAQRSLAHYGIDASGQQHALTGLAHQSLVAVAGIARPEAFFAMLRACGVTLERTIALPDHYDFDSWQPKLLAGQRLICTEKDAVKLWRQWPDALAVPLLLQFDTAWPTAVAQWAAGHGLTAAIIPPGEPDGHQTS